MSFKSFDMMLAQAAGTQPNPNGSLITMVGYIAILGFVFYFLTIRPQSKKAKEHAAMMSAMRPGDKVITSGGVVGTVVSVKEKTVAIRSVESKFEVLKSAISEITERAGESGGSES